MKNHLKIFYATERQASPCFTSDLLAETQECEVADIEALAAREGWHAVDIHEALPDGTVETFSAWEAASMPFITRMGIAIDHYSFEEEEEPLIIRAKADAAKLVRIFPKMDFERTLAAIYRARQFECVRDVAVSLQLPLVDAMRAISTAFGIGDELLYVLNGQLDNGFDCSFINLDEDTRLAALMHLFSKCTDEPLPEFSSEELAIEAEKAVQ